MADEPQSRPVEPDAHAVPSASPPASPPPAGGKGAALLGAVAAALLAWGVGETPIVRVAPAESKMLVMGQETDTMAWTPESIRAADIASASRTLGVAGALLGLALGVASARTAAGAGRNAAVVAGAAGLVAGGIAGAIAPMVAEPLYEAVRTPGKQDLMPVVVRHLALWVPIGLAAGLAFGLGRSRRPGPIVTAAIAGAIGGAIGAVIFQVVGTIALPLAGVDRLIASTPLARGLGLVIAAVSIAGLASTSQSPGGRAPRAKRAAAG